MPEKKKHGHRLTIAICIAIVLAVVFALLAPHGAMKCEVGGEVFLNLLKMLVVPLVMSSVMSGILGLGDVRKLGKPGAAAVGYYLCTTILAVVVGLVVVNLIRPGTGSVDAATLAEMTAESSATKDKIYDHLSEQADVSKEEVAEFFGEPNSSVSPRMQDFSRRARPGSSRLGSFPIDPCFEVGIIAKEMNTC